MGGIGSGPWGTARYYTVEESCVLDTAWLRIRGVLKVGLVARSTSTWTRGGEHVASIAWQVDTTEPGWEHIELSYTVRSRDQAAEEIRDHFTLVTSQPHFGGVRWWFACACGRRCGKLYLPPTARHFRCRTCYRLVYACQRETDADRMLRRAHKIRRRLNPDIALSRPPKPRWMRWATYRRQLDQADALETQALVTALKWLRLGAG
jgi:hypothetical protein